MNRLQSAGFALVASVLSVSQASAALNADMNSLLIRPREESEQSAEIVIRNFVSGFMIFLGLIAVCYALYWIFKIVAATRWNKGSESEKTPAIGDESPAASEGQKILVRAVSALVAVFLLNFLSEFALGVFFPGVR